MRHMRTEGRSLLRKWFRAQKSPQRSFAEVLGVTQQAVSSWLSGASRPDGDTRDLIEKATDGAVPSASWRTETERARIANVRPAVATRPAA